MKATSLYLTLLLQILQVLMCLRWSQAFRNTLSTLCKRHMLAPADAFFSILQLQLCNTHAPTISISIRLSHNTIIIFVSYVAFLNHTQITCVHICVHGTSVLTLPLCHLDVIYKFVLSITRTQSVLASFGICWDPNPTNSHNPKASCCITGWNLAPHCLKGLR